MIPVYLCTLPHKGPLASLRDAMFLLCRNRWQLEPAARTTFLTPAMLECSEREFQRERRIEAERRALECGASFYVVADDDCLPQAGPFLEEAVETLKTHPGYAVLSLLPTNATIHPWRPQDYWTHENTYVMEHVNVGGIRVCRVGTLTGWPAMDPEHAGYDAAHAEAIRDAGRRVGYFKRLRMNHLGEGYSSVWPKSP